MTIGLIELLYTHFGIVVDLNDGKISGVHLEEREGK